jgi:hypothetical protein
MQMTAWRVHTPISIPDDTETERPTHRVCLSCGMSVPIGAIAENTAYQNGGIWSSAPKGNALPCHSGK